MIKKLYLFLTLLTALLCFGAGNAWGETITVANDASSYQRYLPFDGYNCDAAQHNQFIIPASELTAMTNSDIAGMKFYTKAASYTWQGSSPVFTIKLAEVEASTQTGLINTTFTQVYAGQAAFASYAWDIAFDDAFNYHGGNLLVDISSPAAGYVKGNGTTGSEFAYVTRTNGGYGQYAVRAYMPKITFTYEAPSLCAKPELTLEGMTNTTASFSWSGGSAWEYLCLPAATTLTDEHWESATQTTNTSVTVDELTQGASYNFYLRADCGIDGKSKVANVVFSTAKKVAPWSENFDGMNTNTIPTDWDNSGSASSTAAGSSKYYVWGVFQPTGGSKMIRMYNNMVQSGSALINTPAIYLPEGAQYELKFNYSQRSNCTTFVVKVSTDGGKTFTKIGPASTEYYNRTAANSTADPGDFTTETISLNSYVGKSIILQFYSVATYNGGSIFVDNVNVKVASSCTDPSDVNAVAASATSATVSWTENGSATAWNIQYSTDNFATHTDVNNVTTNPYTLTGLSGNTTYKVRVQANCGSEQSDWVASDAFPTPCESINGIGFTQNFDYETAGSGKIPDCWQKITNNNSYPQISSTASYQKTGSTKCLYFYGGVTGSSEQIAILPPFTEATNTLYVTLDYSQGYYDSYWEETNDYSGSNYGQLSVGYVTNSTFTPQESLPRVSAYATASVALTNAPAGSRVAIRYSGGSSAGYLFVDNITISAIPSCLAPSGVAGSATDVDEASISWTANGSETAWKIKYSSDNGETWSDEIAADANPFTLSGLSAQTTYIAQVKSDCGGGEYSEWSASSLPFSTPCQPVDASDYSETMESATTGAGKLPDCWQYREKYSTGYPYVYNYAYYAYAGNNSLYFYGGVDGSSEQSVLLPEMNQPLNELTFEFYYKVAESAMSTYAKFTVGYIAADGTTFVPVETLNYADSYTKYTKDLSALPADAKCLAIRFAGGESSAYGYIDNVRVYPTPTCAAPTGVTVSNVTATTADVAWTENNGATAWKIQLSNDGSVWGDAIDANSNPFTVSSLTPNHTIYYARVKAICGVGDESPYSEASDPFETKCAAEGLPFSEDFSAAIICWKKVSCDASTGLSSGKFKFNYNSNPPQYLVSPEIDTEDKPVTVEFDYYVESASWPETFNIGYSTTTNEVSAFTFGAVTTATNTSTNVLHYTESLPVGVKYVAIQYLSNDKYALYIDNFSVTEYVAPACPAVSAATLEESNVTAHTATVSWTAGGEETAWNLQYKAAGGEWSAVIPVATTPSYDLAGLAENTLYYVRVQANCGEGLSEWTGDEAFSFPTDCEPKAVSKASPWNYDFEDTNDGFMPSCWERTEPYANYGYPVVSEYSYYAQSGDKYLYLRTPGRSGSSYTEDAILPVFNTEIKNLKVSFSYFNGAATSNYGQLAIGYVVGNEFTQVGDLLAQEDDYTSVEREMPNDAPDGARIAIRCIGSTKGSTYTTTAYLDDIQVSLKPTCYTPTALAAAETSDGAVLTWTAGKDENEWSIRYSVKDADSWTTIDEITATNYTFTGLSQNVTYEVQVKAVCGVGDESAWSASAEFTPVCNAPSALAVTARTQNSATFSWTSSESAWVLQYSVDGENWESANVNANPFTLTGLTAGATYDAKIQAACGSAFSNVVEFTTWCDSKLSLPVNLTSFTAIPACWEESPAGAISFNNSKLCFVGEGERFLYLPQTDVNLNLLSATFTFSGSLEFGYIDAPNGAFHAFASQPTSGIEIDLVDEVAAAKYIAIRYNGASNLSQASISAISIRKTPSCLAPTGVDATPSVGGAEISWTAGGSETAWNIQYKLASVASWDGAAQVAVSENPFEISGLEQGVSYKVRVQANCGEELSDWSDEAEFTTDCDVIAALPFIETFDAALSNCWDITDEETATYAHSVYGGELRLPGGKAASGHLVKLPNITADLTNAVMTLEYKATTGSGTAIPQVGYIDGEDAFQELATLDKSNTTTEARVALAAANGKRLALRYDDGTSEGNFDIAEIRILEQVTLADNANNSAILASHNGKAADVVIGRTIVCADYYNTICLPFSLSAEEFAASPIASNDLWAFKYAKVDEASGELLFRIIEADHIEAGVPYFIGFENNEEDIMNPLFKNVTISATAGQEVGNDVAKLCGIVDQPVVFNAGDQTKLFLAASNTLYWWAGDHNSQLNNFRAYFKVQTSAPGAPARHGMPARLIKQDQEEQIATGINNTNVENVTFKFIENDQVVIIRNGVKYNIQGQVISK